MGISYDLVFALQTKKQADSAVCSTIKASPGPTTIFCLKSRRDFGRKRQLPGNRKLIIKPRLQFNLTAKVKLR